MQLIRAATGMVVGYHGPVQPPSRVLQAVLLFLCLMGALARTHAVVPVVFDSGKVRLLDTDSYYHLRHARYCLYHFPTLDRWDALDDYPYGVPSDAAGLFDITLAGGTLLLTGGRPDEGMLLTVCAWTPVVFSVLALLALYALAREWLTPLQSLVVVTLFLAYPGEALSRGLLGEADHHVAEILLSLLIVRDFYRCLRGKSSPLRGALPLLLLLFTWAGGPLYIALLFAGVLPLLAREMAANGEGAQLSRRVFFYAAVVGLVSSAIAHVLPQAVLSKIAMPRTYGACCLLALFPGCFFYGARVLIRRGFNPQWVGVGGLLGVGVVAVLVLAFTRDGRWLAGYLLRPKESTVREHAVVTAGSFFHQLGIPGVLALLSLPLTFRKGPNGAVFPASVGCTVGFLWYCSHDYGYQVPAFSALMAVLVLAHVKETYLLLLTALLITLPCSTNFFQRPWASRALAEDLREMNDAWESTANWIKSNTPVPQVLPGGLLDYGIAAAWDRGNFITTLAGRPAVWSRYPRPASGRWFITTSEEESLQLLSTGCQAGQKVRYVVVDGRSVAQKFLGWVVLARESLTPYRSMGGSLTLEGQTLTPATYGPLFDTAIAVRLYYASGNGLSHYRQVYESPQWSRHFYRHDGRTLVRGEVAGEPMPPRPPLAAIQTPEGICYDISSHPAIKVFEIVKGARVTGTAPTGASLRFTATLLAKPTARSYSYANATSAGPDGRFSVTLAQSGSYHVDINQQTAGTFTVPERAVENGEILKFEPGAAAQ